MFSWMCLVIIRYISLICPPSMKINDTACCFPIDKLDVLMYLKSLFTWTTCKCYRSANISTGEEGCRLKSQVSYYPPSGKITPEIHSSNTHVHLLCVGEILCEIGELCRSWLCTTASDRDTHYEEKSISRYMYIQRICKHNPCTVNNERLQLNILWDMWWMDVLKWGKVYLVKFITKNFTVMNVQAIWPNIQFDHCYQSSFVIM